MPRGRVSTYMSVDGADKYKRLARRLKEAGRGDLQRRLSRTIRREGQAALNDVRVAWMGVDVTSSRGGTARPDVSTGLRSRVAAATRIQVLQNGTRISVNTKKVDPAYPSLAWYLNGSGRRPWRHPIFGRRDNPGDWAEQRGEETFFKTMSRHAPAWRRATVRVIDEIAREIEG